MRSHVALVAAIVFGTLVGISGLAWSDEKGKGKKEGVKEAPEMAGAAKITIDQAIKTASEKVPGKVIEAELEKKYSKLLWEVEIVTMGNTVMEVHIDAVTGAVVNVSEEDLKHGRKSE